jgi:hypothetical protein
MTWLIITTVAGLVVYKVFLINLYNNPKSIKENNNLVAIKKEVPRIKI